MLVEKWTSSQFKTPFVFKELLYCTIFFTQRISVKLEVGLEKTKKIIPYNLAIAYSTSFLPPSVLCGEMRL
jgi:hypothetical protein